MVGYFNDGNGVKNITDGYFYDGDVKYYKDVVITKYWKEVETTVNGVVYACYYKNASSGLLPGARYYYAKMPIGSDMALYYKDDGVDEGFSIATDVSQLSQSASNRFTAINETNATLYSFQSSKFDGLVSTRHPTGDVYGDVTTTTVVEGTPEDYTQTTTETTTVEVSADDEYEYKEYYPKKIKQIYKVINGEAKLIFNNE